MKISCTVKEFGQLVRGCERAECWKCPLETICKTETEGIGSGSRGKGIEQFISAEDVVDGPETGGVSDG